MAVTVTPETFTMVLFDHDAIVAAVERIASQVGMADADISIEVNEAVPLVRAQTESLDPIRLSIDGGAFEDPRHPRQLSEHAVIDTVGRLLLQAQDRLSPSFGDPPADGDIPLPHRVAWEVYAVGRLQQLGYDSQRQRRLYGFRNRHGFTDAADAAFEQLWTGSGLTWTDITRLSDDAAAVRA
ncbi:MAG: hypothetical protein ACXWB2_00285 [Acidimicrobiales bacterium]